MGKFTNFIERHSATKRVSNIPDSFRTGIPQFRFDKINIDRFLIQAVNADFQSPQGFLQGFLKRAANRHDFTHRFHLGGEPVICLWKFFKSKTRYLGNHIIYGWLKRGWHRATSNIVPEFIQCITHGKFCRHFGNRKSGGFGSQGGGAGHSRIHLDNQHSSILWVDGELNVGTTGFHTDFAQYRYRCVAHDLIFFVCQRLRRGDSDGISRMNTHWIEVFDGTDDNTIIVFVTYDFHFEFFPTNN